MRGDVTKRVNARDENENNNTGFGVIRIQVASKSARAPLAGSDRGTGTSTRVRDETGPTRPSRGPCPGYKIEPCPTISRENFIYFISDVPGNRRKPGASQISVKFFNRDLAAF